jgi:5-formyltetrahydrofolate cyclo-ligase
MNIRERKMELRKEIEHKRSMLSDIERATKQKQINERLIQLGTERLSSGQGATLLTYMPFRSEPDVTPFMEWCWKAGVRVLLPRVVPETRSLILHEIDSYRGIDNGTYGIREPKLDSPVERDISTLSMVLVPGLAFDREFGRLGYGGGYYDRFMQLFAGRGVSRPYSVAAAFDVQIVPEVPASWHDFRVDSLISESVQMVKK